MIKLKNILKESDDMLIDNKKEVYVIQKNYIGYDAWSDATGEYDNKNTAVKIYVDWQRVLDANPKNKEIIRLIKRIKITKEEIINI
jgi:predicted nucleic acid-binding OB-fold protein